MFKDKNSKMPQITVRLPMDIFLKVEQNAKENKMKLSCYLRNIIKKNIEQLRKEIRK